MTHHEYIHDKNRWNLKSGLFSRAERLHQRQQIISTIRDDLYSQDFLEVETPLLVKGTCPDAYIDSISAGGGYLITSTEYQVKRMIAGGFKKIFTLTKNFRANDCGRYHSSEFTMLEWGRAFTTLHEIEEDIIRFIRQAFHKLYPNKDTLVFNGDEINFMSAPWERTTVREAFKNYLGLKDLRDFSLPFLLSASQEAGLSIPQNFQHDKYLAIAYLFDQLQPHLGKKTPTFLQEWPAYLTTSAPICLKDPNIAERSELYIGGIEIADGFPFLRDPQQQRHLFSEELEKRKEVGKPEIIIDEKYIESLKDLPSGAGMALGIDRLVMVLTGATKLSDIQSFHWDEL